MGATRVVARGEAGYPAAFERLSDPPRRIYLAGPWIHDGPLVAVVGSRNADGDGLDFTRELARDLVRAGAAVISGLARGVDAAAHAGALDAGGASGAVLGTPLTRVFPAAHRELQSRLAASLGLLSELPPDASPTRSTFASRNRLLAALADAVVVVQGRTRSGALLTVKAARALGRPIGAVPWDPREPLAAAPLSLLRGGRAEVVRHAADVLEMIGTRGGEAAHARAEAPPAPPRPAPGALAPDAARLLAALRRRAEPLDVAAARAGLPIAAAGAALVSLELDGRAERGAGGLVRRARGR